MPLLVGRHPVDVGIDSGIAPIEKQARLGDLREVIRGMAVVHPVVRLLPAVPHGIINHVASFLSIRPDERVVPDDLRRPHPVDGTPVFINALILWIAEDGLSLPIVESGGSPVDEVVALEEIDAEVVPGFLFPQARW